MKNRFFISLTLLCLYIPRAYSDDICNPLCPNGYTEVSICFVDPDADGDFIRRTMKYQHCGWSTDKYTISSHEDFDRAFIKVSSECKKIKKLMFVGHGDPNYHGAGRINRDTVKDLQRYQCVMATNANIELMGCNTGRGCMGQVFMHSLATSLLSRGGGQVTSPTFGSTSTFTQIFSLNGRNRVLYFDPHKTTKEKWDYSGLTFATSPPTSVTCSEEINEVLKEYDRVKSMANNSNCSPEFSIEHIANRMREKSTEVSNFSDTEQVRKIVADPAVIWAMKDLNYETAKIERCIAKLKPINHSPRSHWSREAVQ